jgi:hypothetical protein
MYFPYTRQIPLSGNPPMAQSATLREQYWLPYTRQIPLSGNPPIAQSATLREQYWLPYTLTPLVC